MFRVFCLVGLALCNGFAVVGDFVVNLCLFLLFWFAARCTLGLLLGVCGC